jgi:hydroxymethylpyrimidine pyrophosphatase-like HAD family hydrolase
MLVQSLPAGNGHIKTLEVLPSGTDKWTSICRLSKSLGIAAQDVVAIGDSNNDVSMVGNAGCGIAMGNACDAVRQAAIHSTLSNGSGGFAMAVEKVMAGAW